MRLQLTAIAMLIGWVCGCSATPETTLRGEVRGFSDESAQVVSPRVEAGAELESGWQFQTHWTADAISSATPVMAAPDALTRATEYEETRHQTGVDTTYAPDELQSVTAGYTLSREPDYTSHTAAATASREVFGRRTTLSAGGRTSFDRVGRSDLPAFDEELWTAATDLSWSQIINPEFVVRGVYTFESRQGYQANPYRWVPVYAGDARRPDSVLAEQLPDGRFRQAAEGFGMWAPRSSVFVRGGYRFYTDDWGVDSHTLRGELWWLFFDDLLRTRLRLRAYTQSGADFWSSRYEEGARWRTGDYRLSPMSTLSAGLRATGRLVQWSALDELALTASYDITYFDFDDYPVRDHMIGHLVGFSLTLKTP